VFNRTAVTNLGQGLIALLSADNQLKTCAA